MHDDASRSLSGKGVTVAAHYPVHGGAQLFVVAQIRVAARYMECSAVRKSRRRVGVPQNRSLRRGSVVLGDDESPLHGIQKSAQARKDDAREHPGRDTTLGLR